MTIHGVTTDDSLTETETKTETETGRDTETGTETGRDTETETGAGGEHIKWQQRQENNTLYNN
jgi:hypothetical protein